MSIEPVQILYFLCEIFRFLITILQFFMLQEMKLCIVLSFAGSRHLSNVQENFNLLSLEAKRSTNPKLFFKKPYYKRSLIFSIW